MCCVWGMYLDGALLLLSSICVVCGACIWMGHYCCCQAYVLCVGHVSGWGTIAVVKHMCYVWGTYLDGALLLLSSICVVCGAMYLDGTLLLLSSICVVCGACIWMGHYCCCQAYVLCVGHVSGWGTYLDGALLLLSSICVVCGAMYLDGVLLLLSSICVVCGACIWMGQCCCCQTFN